VGCVTCHVETLTTAPVGTKINGGAFTIPTALVLINLHPYGDFLMHDVGTGDGILQAIPEHYGHRVFQQMSGYLSNKISRAAATKSAPRLCGESACARA